MLISVQDSEMPGIGYSVLNNVDIIIARVATGYLYAKFYYNPNGVLFGSF